jgi:hypothetical protein
MKKLFAFIIFLSANTLARAQMHSVYGINFSYKSLFPTDTFDISKKQPEYYVHCLYKKDSLREMEIHLGKGYNNKPLVAKASIIYIGKKVFFIYRSGKIRMGYGKLFYKKTKISDTAMLLNDTLVFKTTTSGTISIHYVTKLFSDTVLIDNKIFFITNSRKKSKSVFSFENYLNWKNNLPPPSKYYSLNIISGIRYSGYDCKMIYDNTGNNSCIGYSASAQGFPDKIEWSLFWLKHLGFMY